MNRPLVAITWHVCRSWRTILLSTPTLWTQLDFTVFPKSQLAKEFHRRSDNYLLDIYQFLENPGHEEPFLSTMLCDLSRLRRLDISSSIGHLEPCWIVFGTSAAAETPQDRKQSEHHRKGHDPPQHNFRRSTPRLTSLSLHFLRTDLRSFNLPSLTRFSFGMGSHTSIQNLISFLERCPLLEFIQICLAYYLLSPEPPADLPKKRVCLAALKELRFDPTACISGLLDHLILPKCTEMRLKGQFTGGAPDRRGSPTPQIHPSSINHLPATREITKAVAMPNLCIFLGPNGNLRFWCFSGICDWFNVEFFTLFSPVSVLEIRELWVGRNPPARYNGSTRPWIQTLCGILGACYS